MIKTDVVSPNAQLLALRADFPLLDEQVRGHPLVYLDNSNTTQKPRCVLEAMADYYTHHNANIHRSVYLLSERATALFEATRDTIRAFIGAKEREEIVFVKGTTEAINLVADSFSRRYVGPNDEILITEMEHHANIVPWQLACERLGARLVVVPITDEGTLVFSEFVRLLSAKTKLVALTHVSNVLGTINPLQAIIAHAHAQGVPVLVDGAQGVPHIPVDVQALDCDFYVFSGHKLYGPTGVGVLYGKRQWLAEMPPYQGGGSMIREVTFEKTHYQELPYKFEAGTPPIAEVVGLGAAVEYLMRIGMPAVSAHEQALLTYATAQLAKVPGLRVIGQAPEKAAVISFVLPGIHPHDAGTALDSYGVAVRVGHHCAMPLMRRYGVPATLRASFGIYNTPEEVNILVDALLRIKALFR